MKRHVDLPAVGLSCREHFCIMMHLKLMAKLIFMKVYNVVADKI